ncbi:MAG: hypothetical protein NC206_02570 [Bacteroides sp.]|nr:hypothetical protein [Roseburia sp.]MCM1345947.1 hypothetical protein [Bacteroides sp.]MCM1420311.1 hypothetical protein [Bacteroides sp.]
MDKNIKELLKYLKIELLSAWIIVVLCFICGETGLIPNGEYAADERATFVLGTVGVMLTLVGVPLSLKLFTLSTTRGLRRCNFDEALASYHLWSCIRVAVLLVCVCFNVVVYYLVVDVKNLLCALIPLVVTLYCLPTKGKIERHLESCNNTID